MVDVLRFGYVSVVGESDVGGYVSTADDLVGGGVDCYCAVKFADDLCVAAASDGSCVTVLGVADYAECVGACESTCSGDSL